MINLKTKEWEIKNIETVIFDKDGTLIDLHFFWGEMTRLRASEVIKVFSLDKNSIEKLCLFLGYDLKKEKMLPDGITALYSRSKIIEIFKKNLEEFEVFTSEKQLEEIFDKVSDDFYKDILKYTKPIKSAIKFTKNLHSKNIKLAIVTADSVKSTKMTVEQFNWSEYFQVLIGRESHPDTKESGKPTLFALEKLNANPKTTIMIGDSPTDYISAKNARIEKTILVSTGQVAKEELEKNSKYCVNSLDEIELF